MGVGLSKMLSAYSSATRKVRKIIDGIIDESSFVELDTFIGGTNELGEYKGEGLLCGMASVCGKDIALMATNPEVFEGGISKRGAEKIERLVNRAISTGTPLVSVLDTAGARILEGIDSLYGYGLILNSFAKACGTVPVFTVVTGKNYGMLSYISGLSDLCIAIDKAQMSTSSPLLITAAAGDGVNYSSAKALAASSGSITNVAKNIDEVKSLLDNALSLYCDMFGEFCEDDDPNRVGKSLSTRSTAHTVIKEVCDANTVFEVRSAYAPEVITALARLDGVTVGVVSVNDKLTAKGSTKITEFVNSAANFNIPVINLVNCSGVIIDPKQEACCLMRSISDLVYAYSNADIPKIALITGEAVGASYSILAAKQTFDYTFAWENANISPLESTAAARLLYGDKIAASKNSAEAEKKFAKEYGDENSAMTAAGKGYLDNVIIPNHSRQYLIAALHSVIKR